jgi:outer membrane protein assembly factor BamB
MRRAVCVLLVASSCLTVTTARADWPRFRGPNGSATCDATGLPVTWSETENIAWRTVLPGPGSSSPIVTGGKVFVTCYSGYGLDRSGGGDMTKLQRDLMCVDATDGRILWTRSVPAVLPEDRYGGMLAEHGYASSTPATDGERVYVFYGKSGVLAYDLAGEELWRADVGKDLAIMSWGSGASLMLHKDMVIVNANAESQSIVALDKLTGEQKWKSETKGYEGSWSTPVLVQVGDKTELCVNMPGELWGLNPDDGGLLWYTEALGNAAYSSLVAGGDMLYAVGGGPGGAGSVALKAGGRDDVSTSHVAWKKTVGSSVPSPVLAGEYLNWVDDRGVAHCLKAATGEQMYRERLPGAGGFYASVLAADDKLYAVSRRNGTFVLAQGPELKVLAHNELPSDDTDFNASPAVDNGRLLLRSGKFLYCIGAR